MSRYSDITVKIPNNWRPRQDQMKLWKYLEGGGDRAAMVAHRRWGKDDVALHYTATAAMQRPGNYWHMLPQYGQARKAIWKAINPRTGKNRIDEAFPPEIRTKTLNQEMSIELKGGSMWQLVGSDNYNSIVGAPPVGLVMSEWAIANPMAWAYLAPILEENGGWALFIYTSRGNNHGRSTYEHAKTEPGWFSQRLRADQTPVFKPEQLLRIEKEYKRLFGQEMGGAMFEQEYMCSWEGSILGAYFAKELRVARSQGRIGKVPHQTGQHVDTFWDLGIDDSMTIWFMQPSGQAFNFIDYYEGTGYGLAHYAKVLEDKNYIYGNHFFPHDINQREMTNTEVAMTRKQVAESLGIKPIIVVPRARSNDEIIKHQIPMMREGLSRCWFDKEKCEAGISALENYRAEYDDVKKKLGNRPVHDWASHGADGFRTFAVGYKDTAGFDPKEHLNQRIHIPTPTGWMAT